MPGARGADQLTRAIVAEKKRHSERVKKRMGREKTSNGERFLP